MIRRQCLRVGLTCAALLGGLLSSTSPAADRPNVLLIVSDDLTACLGCYGNEICKTPHLDRLAREGVRFDRAYCQFPVCGASRASLMSGLYPNRTRILGNSYKLGSYRAVNPQLADHPSIGGFLRRNGYRSERVSKIFHMGVPGGIQAGEPGGDDPDSWDRAINITAPERGSRGQRELLSPTRTAAGTGFYRVIVPDEFEATQADHLAATEAIGILEDRAKQESPFFLAVGFVRPHVPLVAPKRLFDKYPEGDIPLPDVPADRLANVPRAALAMDNADRYGMNELQQRKSIAGYYASVTFMDEQVGRLLDALDRLDLRENTVVVFTSDHGYNLGEHRCWQKLSLWEESVRVPLIVSAPGMKESAGKSSPAIVELIDLYPTLAELARLKDKQPAILHGTSLVPLLENPDRDDWPKQHAYTVTQQGGESIRTPRWRYNHWRGGEEELYDHDDDPEELRNLAESADHADRLKELRGTLEQTRAASRQ
ncbi:MAG: sulfatase [Planctomycetaceae bacterium]